MATVVLSAIMLMKQAMGVMPELNPIAMITKMAGSSTPMVGWIGHFMIGTVLWGLLYAALDAKLPGPHWRRLVSLLRLFLQHFRDDLPSLFGRGQQLKL